MGILEGSVDVVQSDKQDILDGFTQVNRNFDLIAKYLNNMLQNQQTIVSELEAIRQELANQNR